MTHVATNTMRRLIYFLQFHQGCRMAPGTVTITLQRNESVVDILVSLGEPGRGVRLPRPAFEAHLGGQCATWAEHAAQTPVSYTHLRAHETKAKLVCRLLLEKKTKRKRQRSR